jgi:hypothetical protein
LRVTFRATVERGRPDQPRYVVLPDDIADVLGLERTTTVIGSVAGAPIVRQAVKKVRGGASWFLDVTAAQVKKAGIETGDVVEVELEVVGEELPADLAAALAANPHAQAWWESARPSQRRQAVNSVEKAKSAETRARRIDSLINEVADFHRWRTSGPGSS